MRPLWLCLLLLFALPACQSDSDVTRGEDGTLRLGREEARAMTERAVRLGDRTLVLDSETGSLSVVGTDAEEVRLRIERIARGATLGSAQSRLERLTIDEAGDDEIYQYVFRCNGVEGARIDVVAEVPRGARLNVALERGTIRLSDAAGDVAVLNELGSVEATGLGGREVSVQTELGDIEAAFAALPAEADVQIETGNGSVTLTLPGGASAEVSAQTQTGTIAVEGLAFTDRALNAAGNRFRGRLGRGEAEVAVETEVGSISLNEGAAPRSDGPESDTTVVPPGAPVAPSPPVE
ncbi:MAG: DUF4097 family beta strand repeat-containing protein [Bacteroidota bacterium]